MKRLFDTIKKAYKPSVKTIWWLLSLMIPVSFAVFVLNALGVIGWLSQFADPMVRMVGLRGEAAVALITGFLLNIYSAIAVMESIGFSGRENTILAIMVLIAHNLIIESAVQKKTGSNGIWMVVLRLTMAFVAAFLLNFILPNETETHALNAINLPSVPFLSTLIIWLKATLWLILKVALIVTGLNILQQLMDEYGFTKWLSTLVSPILQMFGLPVQAAFMWIIANVIGLSWGSAIMIQYVEEKRISRQEADILNHHIAITHSLLEDTLLFVAIGVPVIWITAPRLLLSFIVVWLYRAVLMWRAGRL